MNGRMGKDATVGQVTCKEVSVTYYVICSPALLPLVREFYVRISCVIIRCVCLILNL